jgi:hypothetical protein
MPIRSVFASVFFHFWFFPFSALERLKSRKGDLGQVKYDCPRISVHQTTIGRLCSIADRSSRRRGDPAENNIEEIARQGFRSRAVRCQLATPRLAPGKSTDRILGGNAKPHVSHNQFRMGTQSELLPQKMINQNKLRTDCSRTSQRMTEKEEELSRQQDQ